MKFTNSLIKGKLLKRYKRFFADIKVNNKIITAHCPNTGSMQGLLDKGNEVLVTEHDDPKRKLKYSLELIKANNNLVGVNTHLANKIVEHGLNANLINELSDYKCEIIVSNPKLGKMYTGSINNLNLPFIGLEKALKLMYKKIKHGVSI